MSLCTCPAPAAMSARIERTNSDLGALVITLLHFSRAPSWEAPYLELLLQSPLLRRVTPSTASTRLANGTLCSTLGAGGFALPWACQRRVLTAALHVGRHRGEVAF
ncbi:hypothetical protein PLICRDRAFT_265734 [Plicaturopsis crispa FD-325 SS-3]|nr:hypothetical protein PLICRDRAFT_265734 [Plicaturopsis crispa FD-325 SS-3]